MSFRQQPRSRMGDGGCCCGKRTTKIIGGLSLGLLVCGALFLTFRPSSFQFPALRDLVNKISPYLDENLPAGNISIPFANATAANATTRISKADIKALLQSVEAYKSSLPADIVNTVHHLVEEHPEYGNIQRTEE